MPLQGYIRETILSLLSDGHIRLTPSDLVLKVQEKRPGVSRQAVRKATKALIANGRLTYTHHFSASHLELNYKRPVRVSPRIFLLPANCRFDRKPGDAIVRLLDGSAFGGGDHPTTRMVLRGLDAVLAKDLLATPHMKMRALDVGTGSGILALAALKLGVTTALGIDIDPLARDAAIKNAVLNRLSHRFEISDQLPGPCPNHTFDLILANLRPPTLIQIFSRLHAVSSLGAIWVLSGFRIEEQDGLEKSLPHVGEHHIWKDEACSWAAWALRFPDAPS